MNQSKSTSSCCCNGTSNSHTSIDRVHIVSFVVLALFATTSDAFVPFQHYSRPAASSSSRTQSKYKNNGRYNRKLLYGPNTANPSNIPSEKNEQQQQQNRGDDIPPGIIDTPSSPSPIFANSLAGGPVSSLGDNDSTKDMLLESIQGTDPATVFSSSSTSLDIIDSASTTPFLMVDDNQVAEQVESIFMNNMSDENGAYGQGPVTDTSEQDVSLMKNYDNTVIVPPTTADVNEDVKAVLALSGEAAAEAEANIPPEVIEQLEQPIALVGSPNATLHDDVVIGLVTPPPVPVISTPVEQTDTASLLVDGTKMQIQNDSSSTLPVPEILPTSTVVGDPTTKGPTTIVAPSVSKILKFAIPAIGVWLCGPLLSLIDTSAVGVFSGTIQQAALNPAVAVTDYAALLIAFMYTGTTNMVAAAQESDRGTPDMPRTAKTMIGAMQLSTYVGAALGAILFAFARPLLKAIIGNDAISPAVFAAAMKYVRIRALGMPAAALIGSTQAACLGMQDIKSPLYVLVAAAVVNFFGDIIFVGNSNPWIGGAAGAAWATVMSQYVAVAYFIRWLTHKPDVAGKPPRVLNLSKAILEMTSKKGNDGQNRRRQVQDAVKQLSKGGSTSRATLQNKVLSYGKQRRGRKISGVLRKIVGLSKTNDTEPNKAIKGGMTSASNPSTQDNISVRGFLKNRFSSLDMVKFPSKETTQDFSPYVLPVTATQVGRVSGYVAMSHVVASSLGTTSMAAQQVIVSLFYCLCPIADSLSLTAQSLVPGISEKEPCPEKTVALRKTLMGFIKAGAIFGLGMMGAVSAIPLLSGFFTSDAAVTALVNSVVPLLLIFFGTHGFVCGSEGMLLGQKDLGFLGKLYGLFFVAVPYLMLRLKRAALAGSKTVDLVSVWSVFVGYQVVRCGIWIARSLQLQRKTNASGQRAVEEFNAELERGASSEYAELTP